MTRGTALLVGLKAVDPAAYGGWDGRSGCWGCELDVENVQRIVEAGGIQASTLKTADATAQRILRGLDSAAGTLRDGDLFVFYYSGHGGQQPDFDGDEEADGHDETLVAYDREVVDDELHRIWLRFRPGVRIVMLSDSCNSGTNYRYAPGTMDPTPILPLELESAEAEKMQASMIHMGGCRDAATSAGYRAGGAFTMALCNAWGDGDFEGGYRELYDEIVAGIRADQEPQYNEYGPVSAAFRKERPFTV